MLRISGSGLGFLLAGILGLAMAGCGGDQAPLSDSAVMEGNLKEVGTLYRACQSLSRKPPAKVGDLKPYQEMAPAAYQAIASGAIDVLWGVSLTDLSEDENSKDAADEVLAYEKKAPTEGGAVLMKNRTVQTMTADEFKSAKKANSGK